MKTEVRSRKSEAGSQKPRVYWQKITFFCLLSAIFWLPSCSIPNLEQPECTESRGVVKEFYSYHFGNDIKFTPENLKQKEKFLSPDLSKLLQKLVTESDPFTLTDDVPRAFRTAGCTVVAGDKTIVEVLVFWRDETRTEQRKIRVETVKRNDKWLIDNIYNEQINLQNNLNH